MEGFFAECLRILEPVGEISISVPDTEWPLVQYVERRDEWVKAFKEHKWHPEEFNTYMEHINHHFRQRPRGQSFSDFDNHRFAWDFETIQKKLLETGFTNVERRDFDPDLDSHHREVGSLFVKAVKPRLEET